MSKTSYSIIGFIFGWFLMGGILSLEKEGFWFGVVDSFNFGLLITIVLFFLFRKLYQKIFRTN